MPLTGQDIFNEAIGVVPLIHTPVSEDQHLLVVGAGAIASAVVGLRYPTFTQVGIVAAANEVPVQLRQDKRVNLFPRLEDVPTAYRADLITVAIPSLTDDTLVKLKLHSTPQSIVCIAVPNATAARAMKDGARRIWSTVAPYREHLPSGGSAYFLLCSGLGLTKHRVVPAWTRRITDRWVPALFTWAKDEYATLFGGG